MDGKYPYRGELNFINNQFNPSTGTIALRAIFENKKTDGGKWKLLPGMFVRIRIDLGTPKRESLIIDRAIGFDQGLKYVDVVDAENKIQYRRVKTGSLQEGGLRVIEPYQPPKNDKDQPTGVKPDEWVVVGGAPATAPRGWRSSRTRCRCRQRSPAATRLCAAARRRSSSEVPSFKCQQSIHLQDRRTAGT